MSDCNSYSKTCEMLRKLGAVLFLAAISTGDRSVSEPSTYYTAQEHLGKGEEKTAAQREVRLEDFFWSGSGDGPPEFLKNVHSTKPSGKEVIIKTETLIATVYVEGQHDEDMLCLDCISSANGLPLNYTTDRRYWLLTVVAGFLRPSDYPVVEGNLAKLYRIAFTRQEGYHLRITNNIVGKINNTTRNKREDLKFAVPHRVRVRRNIPPDINYEALQENEDLESETSSDAKGNNAQLFEGRPVDREIRILIHNVSLITEVDIQNWSTNYDDVNDQRISRPLANQTEIIYSVFLNGKPVLATAAAEDMKLVSENEVVTLMKKEIYMKAEPYLKEPQATPLVPAGKNGSTVVYNVFGSHPVLIAIASITILLLILLLIALLLMTRAKRKRSAEIKRLSSRKGLLLARIDADDPVVHHAAKDGSISRMELDYGVDNAAFIYEHHISKSDSRKREHPTIDFPLPPLSRPDSTSLASSSDSSVYYPVNKPDLDLQAMLDQTASKLFDKKKRTSTYDVSHQTEHIYSSAVQKRDKRTKTKSKRKYLAENRVGSIEETVLVHSSQGSFSTESISDSLKPDFDLFEANEALNPNANYHRNKILGDRVFTDKIYDVVDNGGLSPTQAINREVLKVMDKGGKISETSSIGSFLSMASIKSFPRQQMPEPLHRVLEPVVVTHYDHFDNTMGSAVAKKPRRTKNVTVVEYSKHCQSDTPDPGVLGPIVWEMHRKKAGKQNESLESPLRDPVSTRNRFEGLLEGAIQMYTEESSPKKTPKKGTMGVTDRWKDSRGKSAIIPSFSRLSRSNSENRPVTAGAPNTHSNNSTQPPTPNSRAWRSGTPSPLVRPLSAGPFHRPESPVVDVTRVLAHQWDGKSPISAAPLIDAIQNELKKFKRENMN